MNDTTLWDAVVIGGGPAGATAANELALAGHQVALLDRDGRIKPCGGAIPPRAIQDFDIPETQLVAKVNAARMVAPSDRRIDMPIDGGFVGMVDRAYFDEWLRARAATAGATRLTGIYDRITRHSDGTVQVHFRPTRGGRTDPGQSIRARAVIGADGAASGVARQCVPGAEHTRYVAAYHEIVRSPSTSADFSATRCDVWYQGAVSPDFYGWVFPHGDTTSVGVGSAHKGFSLRGATALLRERAGLAGVETVRREGAPIPMQPLRCWDDGRNVVLAGDAAGVVAPASGEGIYYAMAGGRLAAQSVAEFLVEKDARVLATARKQFMKEHGRVFMILNIMQWFWYSKDPRRERFVAMCADPDVQRLTWQAYMHKRLVRADPMAHMRIFLKDTMHLLGLARV